METSPRDTRMHSAHSRSAQAASKLTLATNVALLEVYCRYWTLFDVLASRFAAPSPQLVPRHYLDSSGLTLWRCHRPHQCVYKSQQRGNACNARAGAL
jgi:hypothetical protein